MDRQAAALPANDLLPPHPFASRAIVYAVTEIIADEVRSGRAAELGDDLVTMIAGLLARKSPDR